MTKKLYLVQGHDVEGENQDWFVVAGDTAKCIDLWNDHVIANGLPRDGNEDEHDLPRTRTVNPARIYEILPDVAGTIHDGPERCIEWPDVPIVFEG